VKREGFSRGQYICALAELEKMFEGNGGKARTGKLGVTLRPDGQVPSDPVWKDIRKLKESAGSILP
jgi:hypothetical protein